MARKKANPDKKGSPGYSAKLEDVENIISDNKDVLLNFEACMIEDNKITGCCDGCDYYHGLIEGVVKEKKSRVEPLHIILDPRDPDDQKTAKRFNIDTWPSLIAFKDGQEVKRVSPVDFPKTKSPEADKLTADIKNITEALQFVEKSQEA